MQYLVSRILYKIRGNRNSTIHDTRGFTLIETLVALSLLSVAIVAPMTLVSQSLKSAYYARDQVTAYNLAQEGIEAVRAIRDGNILVNALSSANVDLLTGIAVDGQPFVIDARNDQIWTTCTDRPLKTDGTLYGYGTDPCTQSGSDGWTPTRFHRSLVATFVDAAHDEIRIESTVRWRTSSYQERTFTIYENMYRWIEDGSAEQ